MLELFRYAAPPVWYHRLMVILSLGMAFIWLYFTVIHKQLVQRMLEGNTDLLDALIGFQLILELTVVIYASVFWLLKWLLILVAPQYLTLPPNEDEQLLNSNQSDDTSSK